ncbi:MAG: hypothetical protein M1840_008938 [Geoglossum simile]|nr:MAG: hypothetical protein M1840_008938 [Geoglossum simile]
MNSLTLRRLAADHSSLHADGLPPNFLFPPSSAESDDLTKLNVLLAGPQGTPYANGLWKLQLKIPMDYPRSPPKAAFRTRIWHPNVEERTGGVCVDTLKSGWGEGVTLRDVLVTISCLLINPNPDSALNAVAGQLLQDDYEAFSRQAKLMASIHAPVPKDLKDAVLAAKQRGEDPEMLGREDILEERRAATATAGKASSAGTASGVVMKKKEQPRFQESAMASSSSLRITSSGPGLRSFQPKLITHLPQRSTQQFQPNDDESSSDEDNEENASKENNPSLSASPVAAIAPPISPRKTSVLGKRPLSALPTPVDPDAVDGYYYVNDDDEGPSASDRNIAANGTAGRGEEGPQKKTPKLSERGRGINASGRVRDDGEAVTALVMPYEDKETNNINHPATSADVPPSPTQQTADGKENLTGPSANLAKKRLTTSNNPHVTTTTATTTATTTGSGLPVRPASKKAAEKGKTPTPASTAKGSKGRMGLRRL